MVRDKSCKQLLMQGISFADVPNPRTVNAATAARKGAVVSFRLPSFFGQPPRTSGQPQRRHSVAPASLQAHIERTPRRTPSCDELSYAPTDAYAALIATPSLSFHQAFQHRSSKQIYRAYRFVLPFARSLETWALAGWSQ